MLSYKTGSFPTGVSTLLLTLPVLTGERSQTYIKHRKPLCKAVFAHSLDILRLNYRHSRNLRHHSISLQYAFTRKNYYTALRCGIQAFFKNFKIEIAIKNLRIFVHIDQSYLSVLFAFSALVFNRPMLMPSFRPRSKKKASAFTDAPACRKSMFFQKKCLFSIPIRTLCGLCVLQSLWAFYLGILAESPNPFPW